MSDALAKICRYADDIITYRFPNAKVCSDAHFALLAIVRDRKLDRLEVGHLRFNLASALINLCLALREMSAEERDALIEAIRAARKLLGAIA